MVECDGTPVVPRVEAAISWVLQMAKGDEKCPKGGWVEYRNGAWYKLAFGKEQGSLMAAKGAKSSVKKYKRGGSIRDKGADKGKRCG